MNFNIFLIRLGIDPDNFENRLTEPLKADDGYIYELFQKKVDYACPECGCFEHHIKDYYYTHTNFNETDYCHDTLRIKRVRYRCLGCGKTYTIPIEGIDANASISNATKLKVINDFNKQMTFRAIADRYNLSITYVINLFDASYPIINRKKTSTSIMY